MQCRCTARSVTLELITSGQHTNTVAVWLLVSASGNYLLTVSKMAVVMQQFGGTCISVGTAVPLISRQLYCGTLIYTKVLIETLSL